MMKKIVCLLAVLGLAMPAAFAQDGAPLQVGFVYVSPIGDAGWTYQHELGRRAVEAALGDQVSTRYVESVPEGADAERVINRMAGSGTDVIFATSFGYMEPTLKAAARHPDRIFEHATGYKTADNMGNYLPRFYEGRYLGGMAAGTVSKNNVIGYVAAFPIPEVVRGINAFTRGARSVNPDVSVKVIWVNSWYDPGKEREAAETLLAQGADVVTHHTDSPAAVQAAQERGKFAVGYHSDMKRFGEDAQVAAVIHKWEDFYVKRVREVLAGTWTARAVWEGIGQGMVDVVLYDELVGDEAAAMIRAKRDEIAAGTFHPFEGPVVTNEGVEVAAAGATLSDEELQAMNYYVMGVEGSVPQ